MQQPRRTLNMLILQVHNIFSPKVLIWFYSRRICIALDRTVALLMVTYYISDVPNALQDRVHRLAKSCRLCRESTEWGAQHVITGKNLLQSTFLMWGFFGFFCLIVPVFSSLQCWQTLLYSLGFYFKHINISVYWKNYFHRCRFPFQRIKIYRDTSELQAKLPDSLRLFRINIFAPVIT